uniref:Uncharacterized protein n=1 Tax=Glyptapanteles flavicoxis TaxID=463051 RepID=B7S859_9HYME|nr:hypothetical protein GFP_L7_0260 [Glyptapanteles flavicoxis]ACE75086.1 hypothetical protein GFP_L7_0280 [Glyptapanteles flavicoxis]
MSGSKVVLLVLAVGLISLFKGQSGGCAYAKPSTTLKVENYAPSDAYYESFYGNLENFMKSETHGIKAIEDGNVVLESGSNGFVNLGSKFDYGDNISDLNDSDKNALGIFSAGTHNTYESSNSNMTTNMGAWVTYQRNVHK